MNLWATLLGSLCCIGVGRLEDQIGTRIVLTAIAAMLGLVVLAMRVTTGVAAMFGLLVLSRGLGQSTLSVVSVTMVGQWFRGRLNLAMGIFSVALSLGFMTAFPIIGAIVVSEGWRTAWALIGWCLLPGLALIAWWLARRGPEECGLAWEHNAKPAAAEPAVSMTWAEALWHAGVLGVHPRKFDLQPRGSRRGLVQ